EDAPAGRGEPLTATPTPSGHAAWNGDTGFGTNAESALAYGLPRPTFVQAIRVQGTYLDRAKPGRVTFRLHWRSPGGAEHEQTVLRPARAGATEGIAPVWVNDTTDTSKWSGDDQPGAFRVGGIELVTPDAAASAEPTVARR